MRVDLRASESLNNLSSIWSGVTVKTTPTEMEDLLAAVFGPQAMGPNIDMITVKYSDSETLFMFKREEKVDA